MNAPDPKPLPLRVEAPQAELNAASEAYGDACAEYQNTLADRLEVARAVIVSELRPLEAQKDAAYRRFHEARERLAVAKAGA